MAPAGNMIQFGSMQPVERPRAAYSVPTPNMDFWDWVTIATHKGKAFRKLRHSMYSTRGYYILRDTNGNILNKGTWKQHQLAQKRRTKWERRVQRWYDALQQHVAQEPLEQQAA